MRPPLNHMTIRNVSMDRTYNKPGTNSGLIRKALGGTRGTNVRGPGHHHQGWDLYAAPNTPAFAIASGRVAKCENHPQNTTKLGRYVTIGFEAPDPISRKMTTFYALYAHLAAIHVKENTDVKEGAVVGFTGTSGNAAGGPPHLHFAILRKKYPTTGLGDNVDPGYFLGFYYLNFETLFPNWNRA